MKQSWIQDFSASIWTPTNPEISHILYVNNILIPYNAVIRKILFLRAILLSFEIVSRLHIKYSKSSLHPVDMVHNMDLLSDIFVCNIDYLPTKYLGLFLGDVLER